MTSFDTATATPSAVSELVVTPAASKDNNSLQGPIVASIDSGSVQAYAKLEGEDLCYYMRTLQVSLGRKVSNPNNVDIPLGNTKSVSRQHARLFYNFSSQRFELMVFGKNGAFVNERFVERGVTVPLENKTKIQIGEMAFVFLLPKKEPDNSANKSNNAPKHNIDDFGYISTPHQLEKVMTNIQSTENHTSTSSSAHDDYNRDDNSIQDDNDHHSETSETANPYNNRDIKPPYSYASLIAQAINSSSDKRMTLNGIYNYITTNYPYYQMAQNGWQNSIRHNLSLNKAFVKVPRGDAEPGKGAFWTIDSNAETQFTNGVYKRNKRAGAPLSSSSSSQATAQAHKSDTAESARKKIKKEHHYSKLDSEDPQEEEEEETAGSAVEVATTNVEDDTAMSTVTTKEATKTNKSMPDAGQPATVIPPVTASPLQKESIDTSTSQIEPLSSAAPPSSTTASIKTSNNISTEVSEASATKVSPEHKQQQQEAQAQLQLQLQNTIRQHLLDPVQYPLPPSIAQLLPQAIAQLPPQLATQLSSTLQQQVKTDSATVVENAATATTEMSTTPAAVPPKTSTSEADVSNLEVTGSAPK
ncbi:uncharacterized protein ATC70_007843 [Mucor velutinosus]|uniref:Uncharacterized protein n=1 Tax=Mucor velutinosus TaxID=708070 RepID=A0AAN7D2P4_9FUNG|nr:hypothetical protein ATC70_007843 [Mucor velutinosus]